MSFFKLLDSIGLSRIDIVNLDSNDIIRIEKKLIAEQRLNESLSKNDVNQLVRLLEEHLGALKDICQCKCFHGILEGYEAEYIDDLRLFTAERLHRIRYVIAHYFKAEIINFIKVNFNNNNWGKLRLLIHYKNFLHTELTELVVQKLEAKIDSALPLLKQQPAHRVLRKEVNYLRQEDFYRLMGEVDKLYFIRHLNTLLSYIADYASYTERTIFFDGVIRNMMHFDFSDRLLAYRLSVIYGKYGGQQWIVYAFLGVFILMIIGVILYLASLPIRYVPRSNAWEDHKNDPYNRMSYLREDQRLKVLNFAEARTFSVNTPDSPKAKLIKAKKYENPFETPLFSSWNRNIRHGGQSINIINRTDRECVVIAYFHSYYDEDLHRYTPVDSLMLIYALYIPAQDSIKIDAKMSLLRFYMGKRLAGFNNYKEYAYPDSLDAKFCDYTEADAMLFDKGFMFGNKDDLKLKEENLTITRPSSESYQIAWTGKLSLHQFADFDARAMNKRADSATKDKSIIFDLKSFIAEGGTMKNKPPETFIFSTGFFLRRP